MDVTDLVQRLLRRWIEALLVLLLALLAAGAAYSNAGTTLESKAAVVIVPPAVGDTVPGQNPMLNLDNNLAQLAIVLAQAMSAPSETDQAGLDPTAAVEPPAPTGDATYTVSTVTGDNPTFAQLSPQLVFTVTGSTAEAAFGTATKLVAEAAVRLDDLQSQVDTPFLARARLVTVVAPTPAQPTGSSSLRAGGAVGLGVAVLGLLAVLLLDEMLTRRTTRRTRRTSRRG